MQYCCVEWKQFTTTTLGQENRVEVTSNGNVISWFSMDIKIPSDRQLINLTPFNICPYCGSKFKGPRILKPPHSKKE